ncbi:MAG TPA: methionyl-tRNA formyltransferase [Candidatus Paceibacterota bacterium]|nr:methionyl-tRNA formyltransferase [Candidatus Paceibacterota bacterium]
MQPHNKKIAFFGTPPFTVSFLDALAGAGYSPSLIVTTPDRPVGRGLVLTAPEPKQWALKHGVRVFQPETIDDTCVSNLAQEPWDLFIVVAYGKVLPETLITTPTHGTINVHYSLLPKYRGATPVESAILNGDTMTGVCIQQMRFKLDTGPIIATREVSITPSDTTAMLRERLNTEALTMLPDTVEKLFSGTITAHEQDDSQATRCTKISKEDGEISLSDDPIMLDRKFRAYSPWPGLFFFTMRGGKNIRIKITDAHLENGRFVISTVIPESGKPMSWDEFQRWHTF